MSLRYQISLRILLISLFILMLGGTIAIWQARNAVSNEVDSSIKLALQLIKISVGSTQSNETDWIYRLSTLEQTRHSQYQQGRCHRTSGPKSRSRFRCHGQSGTRRNA